MMTFNGGLCPPSNPPPKPRQRYETKKDLDNEQRIAMRLGAKWDCRLVKTPSSYCVDRGALRYGTIVSWIEIKKRNMAWGDYDTIMLSLGKALNAIQLSEITGAPFIFAVEDSSNEIRFAKIEKKDIAKWGVRHGGRTVNTRDVDDIEPIIEVPLARFRPI